MFILHDLHWIAATLNPHTRMLKLATDVERAHAHELVCSEVAKIMEMDRSNDNRFLQSVAAASPSPPPHKKFKSYTTLFEDADYEESNNNMPSSIRARRELETYLQLKLMNCTCANNENDDPLLFWKEQNRILPNLSKLAKKIFVFLLYLLKLSVHLVQPVSSYPKEELILIHPWSMTLY
jgi:hypothetical protein